MERLLTLYADGKKHFTLSQQCDDDSDDENITNNTQNKAALIETYLNSLNDSDLNNLLSTAGTSGHLSECLAAIFSGSPIEKKQGSQRRQTVYLAAVNLLDTGAVIGKVAENCLITLLQNLDRLTTSTYSKLINAAIDGMSSEFEGTGVSFELVSEIVTRMIAVKSGNGGSGRMSLAGANNNNNNNNNNNGTASSSSSTSSSTSNTTTIPSFSSSFSADEYQETIIRRICRTRWNPSAATNVVKGIRGFALAPRQMTRIVRKVLDQLSETELNDLPPLVNQLLLLASKGEQALVLSGLADHFDALDLKGKKEKNYVCNQRIIKIKIKNDSLSVFCVRQNELISMLHLLLKDYCFLLL